MAPSIVLMGLSRSRMITSAFAWSCMEMEAAVWYLTEAFGILKLPVSLDGRVSKIRILVASVDWAYADILTAETNETINNGRLRIQLADHFFCADLIQVAMVVLIFAMSCGVGPDFKLGNLIEQGISLGLYCSTLFDGSLDLLRSLDVKCSVLVLLPNI